MLQNRIIFIAIGLTIGRGGKTMKQRLRKKTQQNLINDLKEAGLQF
jgi:hypothetical protein